MTPDKVKQKTKTTAAIIYCFHKESICLMGILEVKLKFAQDSAGRQLASAWIDAYTSEKKFICFLFTLSNICSANFNHFNFTFSWLPAFVLTTYFKYKI